MVEAKAMMTEVEELSPAIKAPALLLAMLKEVVGNKRRVTKLGAMRRKDRRRRRLFESQRMAVGGGMVRRIIEDAEEEAESQGRESEGEDTESGERGSEERRRRWVSAGAVWKTTFFTSCPQNLKQTKKNQMEIKKNSNQKIISLSPHSLPAATADLSSSNSSSSRHAAALAEAAAA